MSYPQDPNTPYGQPEQNPNPYGQQGQNPYGQAGQSQGGGLFDSGGQQPPFGQSAPNPYGQPANPYDNNSAPTQLYGPGQNPYGQPAGPYDASGGQIPQFGQQPQPPYGQQGFPQQQPFYGQQPPAKNNNGMIIGIVVAVVAVLGVGGYFLASGNNSPSPNPTLATQSSLPILPPAGGGSSGPAPAQGNGAIGSFTPPSTYSSGSLADDDGCGDYAGDEADFLTASFDMSTAAEASTAFDKLSAAEITAAADAQDPTLKGGLAAEAGYIKANEAALSAGMVAYNSASGDESTFTAAFAGDKVNDEYLNGVCDLDSWAPTEPAT